jgi:hypothetical protein
MQHTLAEARVAMFECYAHAVYYRIVAAPANVLVAVFFERYYVNDVAYRLYAAAEHLAAAVEAMLEIHSGALVPYRRHRISRQALVAAYLRRAKRHHPITDAVGRLGRSKDWHRAMTYRGSLVHEQPPLMEGTGIVYERGSRWEETSKGGYRLSVGGGDRPTLSTETVADFLNRAMDALLSTFGECVAFYTTILGARDIYMTDVGKVTVRL